MKELKRYNELINLINELAYERNEILNRVFLGDEQVNRLMVIKDVIDKVYEEIEVLEQYIEASSIVEYKDEE